MLTDRIAKIDKTTRPIVNNFFGPLSVPYYSFARKIFLTILYNEKIPKISIPQNLGRVLWEKKFRNPIMNAAGMFKNGQGYDFAHNFGFGGFLAGTTTSNQRNGNKKFGIIHPFIAYPNSGAASNWLGLPNQGNMTVAKKLAQIKNNDMPVGASIALDPNLEYWEGMEKLIKGLKCYEQAGVDFIEINYSCPNTQHKNGKGEFFDERLKSFLESVKKYFINSQKTKTPTIVKFSNDTNCEDVGRIVQLVIKNHLDGVNFGNTSTNYKSVRNKIDPKEKKLFDHFTKTYGGGVSGNPLKEKSLELCSAAIDEVKKSAYKEFHVFRTGGIKTASDLAESDKIGVSMNMAYTGVMEGYAERGKLFLKELLEEYSKNYLNKT